MKIPCLPFDLCLFSSYTFAWETNCCCFYNERFVVVAGFAGGINMASASRAALQFAVTILLLCCLTADAKSVLFISHSRACPLFSRACKFIYIYIHLVLRLMAPSKSHSLVRARRKIFIWCRTAAISTTNNSKKLFYSSALLYCIHNFYSTRKKILIAARSRRNPSAIKLSRIYFAISAHFGPAKILKFW